MASVTRGKFTMGHAVMIALFAITISANTVQAQDNSFQCYVCSSYAAFVTDPPQVTESPEGSEPPVDQTTPGVDPTDGDTSEGGSSAATEGGGSSAATEEGGSSAVTEGGGSSAATEGVGSSAATEGGGSSTATEEGGSSTATEQGGSSAATEANGSSAATEEGGSSAVTEEGGSSTATELPSEGSSGTEVPTEGAVVPEAAAGGRQRRHPRSVAMASFSKEQREVAMWCGQPGGVEDALGTLRTVKPDESCFVMHMNDRDGDVVIRGVEKTEKLLNTIGLDKEGCKDGYVSEVLDGRKFYVCACSTDKCNLSGRNSATRAAATGGMGALWAAVALAIAAGSKRSSLF